MANKRPKPEEIVSKLRQVEVLMGQGLSRLDAIRRIGVVEQTYYRWRTRFLPSARTRRNMRTASESGRTGSPTESTAVA